MKEQSSDAIQKAQKEVEEYKMPSKYIALLQRISDVFGVYIETPHPIMIVNRGGYGIGYGLGFTLQHRTSSIADGPDYDYKNEIMSILKSCGFAVERSYGDNGLDYSTNWHDTYWNYDIVYQPSIKYFSGYE